MVDASSAAPTARRTAAVLAPPPLPADEFATLNPRLVVEEVSPHVEGGDFAVKRIAGEAVHVEATVFADGHEQLAAELLWRPVDETQWRRQPMTALPTDVWEADFVPDRVGRHEFLVEGWLDLWGGFRRDLTKKLDAGVALAVDATEGRDLVGAAAARSSGALATRLADWHARVEAAADDHRLLLDDDLAALMAEADERPFALRSPRQLLDAERIAARFSSWYELFPRSITDDAKRHGTFDDVVGRLPQIRDMGFDTLYFPPIHPIGKSNRKGKNNSVTAQEGEPGSPYAIGSHEGGHKDLHPQLGSFADFQRLVTRAADHGLELALDFAIQCSPDHPWIKEHPDWFDWRPDGSIKYAENPPK